MIFYKTHFKKIIAVLCMISTTCSYASEYTYDASSNADTRRTLVAYTINTRGESKELALRQAVLARDLDHVKALLQTYNQSEISYKIKDDVQAILDETSYFASIKRPVRKIMGGISLLTLSVGSYLWQSSSKASMDTTCANIEGCEGVICVNADQDPNSAQRQAINKCQDYYSDKSQVGCLLGNGVIIYGALAGIYLLGDGLFSIPAAAHQYYEFCKNTPKDIRADIIEDTQKIKKLLDSYKKNK